MRSIAAFFLLLVCALAIPKASYAESITYTFTGTSFLAGTNFTYVDPSGFLSFGHSLVPTTASHLLYLGQDEGQLLQFDFIDANTYELTGSLNAVGAYFGRTYSLSLLGTQDMYINTLKIEVTPTAVTPEPSSILLLATGILGIGFLYRRRSFASSNATA
jgi:hypothetical protein